MTEYIYIFCSRDYLSGKRREFFWKMAWFFSKKGVSFISKSANMPLLKQTEGKPEEGRQNIQPLILGLQERCPYCIPPPPGGYTFIIIVPSYFFNDYPQSPDSAPKGQ
jgi:hypothetical protein